MPAKEPTKYERSAKGNWVVTAQWKEWIKKKKQVEADKAAKAKPKPKKKEPITAENHQSVWREVARSFETEKRIFFCMCMRDRGFYTTCGAVAIQRSRTSKMDIVVEPRFE